MGVYMGVTKGVQWWAYVHVFVQMVYVEVILGVQID